MIVPFTSLQLVSENKIENLWEGKCELGFRGNLAQDVFVRVELWFWAENRKSFYFPIFLSFLIVYCFDLLFYDMAFVGKSFCYS